MGTDDWMDARIELKTNGGGAGIGANGALAYEPPSPRMDLCAQRFLDLLHYCLRSYVDRVKCVGVRNAIIEC